jgi:hypothetical protein
MIQDASMAGTPMSPALLVRMAQEIPNICYFKIEVPQAASKLREIIRLGGDLIEGPWDGEEGITLYHDLEAGATGAMTGAGYADGIRTITDPYLAGDREAAAQAYTRWLPRVAGRQDPDGGGQGDPLGCGAPSPGAAAPRHARRIDRNRPAPGSAGIALGQIGLGACPAPVYMSEYISRGRHERPHRGTA